MTSQQSDNDAFTATALEVLRNHGPITSEDWAELLVDAGHGTVDEMLGFVEMLDDMSLGRLTDGRNVALDVLLEGRVFTHRLSAPEIASGLLYAEPDLQPLVLFALSVDEAAVLFGEYDLEELEELGLADEDFPEGAGLVVGVEALQGCSPGDVVGVRVRGGVLGVEQVDGDPAQVDLSDALRRIVGEDNADNSETVSWQMLVDEPALFTEPALPLGELVAAAGYECDGEYIASAGFDVEFHRIATHVALVARQAELHPDEATAVITFVEFVRAVAASEADLSESRALVAEDPETFGGLEDPSAAAAALDVIGGFEDEILPALYTASLAVSEKAPRRARASGQWLAGMAADMLGDVRVAERHLEEAVALDDQWTPALLELAGYASDRGDAARGLSLLSRIDGGEDEHLYRVLQRFAPQDHPELGRNDKCWCGSGRKYKVCHLGKSDTTLDERAYWLYDKATLFAQSTTLFDLVLALADLRAGDDADDETARRALEAPLILDVALFEGGLFELFVLRRGSLLPADELELAGRWLLTRRAVHEVTAADAAGVTLRNLLTGEDADVEMDPAPEVGTLLCARVVPTGSRFQILGGAEPVPAARRDELVALLGAEDVEPEDIVELLSEPAE